MGIWCDNYYLLSKNELVNYYLRYSKWCKGLKRIEKAGSFFVVLHMLLTINCLPLWSRNKRNLKLSWTNVFRGLEVVLFLTYLCAVLFQYIQHSYLRDLVNTQIEIFDSYHTTFSSKKFPLNFVCGINAEDVTEGRWWWGLRRKSMLTSDTSISNKSLKWIMTRTSRTSKIWCLKIIDLQLETLVVIWGCLHQSKVALDLKHIKSRLVLKALIFLEKKHRVKDWSLATRTSFMPLSTVRHLPSQQI